jgi:hypothetical protein
MSVQYKGKAVSQHTYGGAVEERMYSSYSFTTSALDGCEWSASLPGRVVPPGKGPTVLTVQEAGWGPRAGLDTNVGGKIYCLCQGSNRDGPVV